MSLSKRLKKEEDDLAKNIQDDNYRRCNDDADDAGDDVNDDDDVDDLDNDYDDGGSDDDDYTEDHDKCARCHIVSHNEEKKYKSCLESSMSRLASCPSTRPEIFGKWMITSFSMIARVSQEKYAVRQSKDFSVPELLLFFINDNFANSMMEEAFPFFKRFAIISFDKFNSLLAATTMENKGGDDKEKKYYIPTLIKVIEETACYMENDRENWFDEKDFFNRQMKSQATEIIPLISRLPHVAKIMTLCYNELETLEKQKLCSGYSGNMLQLLTFSIDNLVTLMCNPRIIKTINAFLNDNDDNDDDVNNGRSHDDNNYEKSENDEENEEKDEEKDDENYDNNKNYEDETDNGSKDTNEENITVRKYPIYENWLKSRFEQAFEKKIMRNKAFLILNEYIPQLNKYSLIIERIIDYLDKSTLLSLNTFAAEKLITHNKDDGNTNDKNCEKDKSK